MAYKDEGEGEEGGARSSKEDPLHHVRSLSPAFASHWPDD